MTKSKKLLFILIFGLSGFTGLIYESVWTDYLGLFLGHAAYAQSLVLVIFMGGMALGSWLISKNSSKYLNLIKYYALMEGIIGILAIIFHPMFVSTTDFSYASIVPALSSPFAINTAKILISILLILPQSVLLGTTFPLMSGGIIRREPEKAGSSIAVLYFVNSFGAAIGVLFSSFVLVSELGLPGTIITAGVINVLIAVAVWSLSKGKETALKAEVIDKETSSYIRWLLPVAALTGMASFIYEIGWIRMLSLVLGSTAHSFEIMLSAFILGLALGGLIIRQKIDKLKKPVAVLAWIQLVMGFFALTTLITYPLSFDFTAFVNESVDKTDSGYFIYNLLKYGTAVLIMLPTAICAGMTLPLITYQLIRKGHGERAVGRVYAYNTIGSIIGVLLGYNLLMPAFGLKNMIATGATIDIFLGIALLAYFAKHLKPAVKISVSAVFVLILIVSFTFVEFDTLKMAVSLNPNKQNVERELIWHADGRTSTVDVIRFEVDGVAGLGLHTNGNSLGNMSLTPGRIFHEHNAVLLAAIPMALHNRAENAATFGMGTGLTSYTLLLNPNIQSLDIIEIEKEIINGARFFGERTEKTYADPRTDIHIEDAKTFFANSKKDYDLIIADPTQPWVSGIPNLYSKEFYSVISNRLADGGIFAQWLLAAGLDTESVVSILKSIAAVFKDYVIYNVNDTFWIVLSSNETLKDYPGKNIFRSSEMKALLKTVGIINPHDVELHRLFGKNTIDALANIYEIEPNSDYNAILESRSDKTRFLDTNAFELLNLRTYAAPVLEVLENHPSYVSDFTVSAVDYSAFAKLSKQAKLIALSFESKDANTAYMNIKDDYVKSMIKNVKLPAMLDSLDDVQQSKWLSSLNEIFIFTFPYLSADDMTLMLQNVDKDSIVGRMSTQVQYWFELYQAVARRDYSNVLQLTNVLLSEKELISAKVADEYLLTLALVSNIALNGTKAEIDTLWQKYAGRNNPPLQLKLLYSVISKVK